jgi:hypothetical protein
MWMAGFKRDTQGLAGTQQMLLADDIVQRGWTQALC